jgi:thiol-disulfide isomerase/thioredoxin
MIHQVFAVAAVLGMAPSPPADDAPQDYGSPPRLVIASGIDAAGNLILSGTEQRKKKVTREVERNGKKTTQESTVTYPVTVLNRQTVALKDVTIYDRDGQKLTIDQARERLKEPTAVLLTMLGEKIDPVYRKILAKEALTFSFTWFPEIKDLPRSSPAGGTAEAPPRKGAVAVGAKVPDFTVRTLDGKTVRLSELQKDEKWTKSGVVVLSFWCSTCSSCRRVEHHLDKLARDYAGQAAVIALDANAGETAERVATFAKDKGLTLPIVLDPSGRTADLFGTEVTTTTVVVDGQGVLRYCGRFREGDRAAYAQEALKAVLAGKEVAVKTTPHDG